VNQARIKAQLDQLAEVDADVAVALQQVGYPEPRNRPAGFETLLSTIISQQLSVRAAATIRQRVFASLAEISPRAVIEADPQRLRSAGMSARKVEYATGLASAIVAGDFNPGNLGDLPDHEAIAEITRLRGFGVWSAEIYLMFSLGRPDIFPADDLALQIALQKLKNLQQKPTTRVARELTNIWSPWRSAASLLLWRFYQGAPT
jgi:DNA-3-methyladenine glycosylase II